MSATAACRAEKMIAASDSPLDTALVERLRSIQSAQNTDSEFTQPMTSILIEAGAWLFAAAIIWALTLAYALRL